MTAEDLEKEFSERGIVRCGILFLRSNDASDLTQRAQNAGLQVLGVDGFILKGKSTQPSMEHSLDLTSNRALGSGDRWDAARKFLQQHSGKGLYFEVVLE